MICLIFACLMSFLTFDPTIIRLLYAFVISELEQLFLAQTENGKFCIHMELSTIFGCNSVNSGLFSPLATVSKCFIKSYEHNWLAFFFSISLDRPTSVSARYISVSQNATCFLHQYLHWQAPAIWDCVI